MNFNIWFGLQKLMFHPGALFLKRLFAIFATACSAGCGTDNNSLMS